VTAETGELSPELEAILTEAGLPAGPSNPDPAPPGDGLEPPTTPPPLATNGAAPAAKGFSSSDSFDSPPGEGQGASGPRLDPAALHGLAGQVVRAWQPHTEADPAGLLLTFLVMAGNMIGPGPHALVGAEHHPARLNALVIGETSRGRKGTAQSCMNPLFQQVERAWFEDRVMDGLSSGEGLISAVRDPADGQDTDAPTDKRLMIVEGEFSRVLSVAGRDGSTLSQVLRSAYDTGRLRVLTRKDPLKASGAHVSIIGHITREELRDRLTTNDAANGFGNRFLFALVGRSKLLPHGGQLDPAATDHLAGQLELAVKRAQAIGVLRRSPDADAIWERAYHAWAKHPPGGLAGALTARPEAHTLRLSVAYALLDGSATIETEHVQAAIALWRYCEQSAVAIFGDTLGDDVADRLLETLRDTHPNGLEATAQYALFSNNVSARRLKDARALLEERRLAVTTTKPAEGPGRPPIISFYLPPGGESNESDEENRGA
jgi:hypothetical protein